MHKRWLRAVAGVAVMLALGGGRAPAQEVHIWVSSQAGDRLSAKPAAHFEEGSAGAEAVTFQVNPAVTYQKIAGFGASFMEAGLMVINTLPPAQQEAVLRAMFDPQAGAGFSAMKTPIAGTDFMSAGPFYTYDPVPGTCR